MPDDAKVLNYAKPAPTSGVAAGLRVVGATVCVATFLVGVAIVCAGVAGIWDAFTKSPTRDREDF